MYSFLLQPEGAVAFQLCTAQLTLCIPNSRREKRFGSEEEDDLRQKKVDENFRKEISWP